jgi:hypothetical protein
MKHRKKGPDNHLEEQLIIIKVCLPFSAFLAVDINRWLLIDCIMHMSVAAARNSDRKYPEKLRQISENFLFSGKLDSTLLTEVSLRSADFTNVKSNSYG